MMAALYFKSFGIIIALYMLTINMAPNKVKVVFWGHYGSFDKYISDFSEAC